ncbi:class A beta-lactamase-related serine hydrolase [Modestobacter marinus]|uniref:class A beta-lactamase-related serine hydrolase n=1 Tax=Modestobacter marinus TaxID=477641 RepID=UPI001C97296C|nr:class A beta-lactamase-related serine hydrolase [Modestobacter marinus]
MAPPASGIRHGAHRAPRRSTVPRSARGRLACLAVASAVFSGLLVRPVLRWADEPAEPVTVAASEQAVIVRPVPRALREGGEPPRPRAVDVGGVLAQLDGAAAQSRSWVGTVVVDEWGRTLLVNGDAERTVATASLVKLLVVQQLLARSADGTVVLDERARRLMERAVTVSGDEAMSALWSRYDGEALLRDAVAAFGLTATAPPERPGQWGEATTTATDLARFLSRMDTTPGAETLLGWMRSVAPTAADGFDQRFGLVAVAPGAAVKQGWMCCIGGRRQLHSVGVLADGRVVVVLGDAPSSTGWSALRRTLDGAAAALVAGTA